MQLVRWGVCCTMMINSILSHNSILHGAPEGFPFGHVPGNRAFSYRGSVKMTSFSHEKCPITSSNSVSVRMLHDCQRKKPHTVTAAYQKQNQGNCSITVWIYPLKTWLEWNTKTSWGHKSCRMFFIFLCAEHLKHRLTDSWLLLES